MNDTLLKTTKYPADLRKLDKSQLPQLIYEVRTKMIETVSVTGGHLGAGLGVVELTVALHYIFNTPDDKLIWDVGHQAYPHKILTGRRDEMLSLRQKDGLYGFTKRSESIYDPFGAGHSSTSISAGLGMAVASKLDNNKKNVICVIGDGAMSAGMAYEAMNNAMITDSRLVVVLNDNDMSIAPAVGGMSAYLSRLLSSKPYLSLRDIGRNIAQRLPKSVEVFAARMEEYAKGIVAGGTLFEELGFYYVGPIDGHNINHLLPVLENIKKMDGHKPILLHIVTKKGHGYKPAENSTDKYHGVSKFDIKTGKQEKSSNSIQSYTSFFGEYLTELAKDDDKIIAITAAMPSGTGTDIFAKKFPNRYFDVGIAEQHAVTFAAGLATMDYKPFVAIYSTFLQRAYDQVIHDVALQSLPVRFILDRAGLVGADGATHAGAFDLSYLTTLPNFIVMAPSNENELLRMIKTAWLINDKPTAIRYPRGSATGIVIDDKIKPLRLSKGKVIQKGKKIAILSIGTILQRVIEASLELQREDINITIADMRFAKPIDTKLITKLAKTHDGLIVIEEGSSGGFSASVVNYLVNNNLHLNLKIKTMMLPDEFISHGSQQEQYIDAMLTKDDIIAKVKEIW